MVSRYNDMFMKEWPEWDPILGHDDSSMDHPHRSTPTPSISSLTNNLTSLSISPEPSPVASKLTQLTAGDPDSLTYLSTLKLILQLSNSGRPPLQIQTYLAQQQRYFSLEFVNCLLGSGEQGLVSVPGADFSAVGIDPVLGPATTATAAAGQPRVASPPPPRRTPAVRALEYVERNPLHINARVNALIIILNAQKELLPHVEMEPQLRAHGFTVSEGFYGHLYFSRSCWGKPSASSITICGDSV